MHTQSPLDSSNGLVDQVARVADHAVHATQRIADGAVEGVAGGVAALRQTSQGLRDGALQTSDRATLYVKEEPLKAMLIAAATGAALMALIGVLARSRDQR
jgi:ElaB/YqjD/DUF883 family membrane-anchored ribosome-binding protein